MRKQHANHGRDHLPTGMDPIPVLAAPYAWAEMTTDQTVTATTYSIIGPYDSSQDSPGILEWDSNTGIVGYQTGVYMISLFLGWKAGSGNIKAGVDVGVGVGSGGNVIGMKPASESLQYVYNDQYVGSIYMGASGLAVVTALNVSGEINFTAHAYNAEATSRDIDVAAIMVVKLRDI